MLNHQVFGTKNWQQPYALEWASKPFISKLENFQIKNALHLELIHVESLWFFLNMGEVWIHKE
jgi:hypothetical protein